MTIEKGAPKGKEKMRPEELSRAFEAARTMNLIFPQVIQGISIAMLGEVLQGADPTQAVTRFMRTQLPAEYARRYAEHGSAAHTARGFVREVDPVIAAQLWEQEKRVAIAILVRIFLTAEDKKILGIDTPYIRDMSSHLMQFLYTRKDGGPAIFNEEGIRTVSELLALRMRADTEGVEAVRLYVPLFKEALERLDKELSEYRNGFASIVEKYRNEDLGRYNVAINAHTEAMLQRALAEVRTLLEAQELPRSLKARLALFVDVFEKQYSAF